MLDDLGDQLVRLLDSLLRLVDEGRLDLGPLRRILLGILITQKPTSARLRGRAVDRLSLPITRLSRLEFLTVSVLPLV